MKKRLLLITNGYPFGELERGFLGAEAKLLASCFDLVIMALDNQDKLLYPTEGITYIEQYRFSSFRQTLAFRALPQVFEWKTFQEAWRFAKVPPFHPLLPASSALNLSQQQVFSNELALRITWPKYRSFSSSISPSNEYSGLISFRIDWFDLPAVQRTPKSLLQHHSSKASML